MEVADSVAMVIGRVHVLGHGERNRIGIGAMKAIIGVGGNLRVLGM